MNADFQDFKHLDLTESIIGACYKVYNSLGYGFLEKVYENAVRIELTRQDLAVKYQHPIKVRYEGEQVGEYFADLLVNDKVIVEIKSVSTLTTEHQAQLLNYLKATAIEVGLLVNFGPNLQIRRKALRNTQNNPENPV